LAKVLVEKHRRIGDRPREVDILPQALRSSNTVLQSAFIEHVRREFGQAGVHSVLNLKSDRPVPKKHQALEEGLSQTCSSSLLVHDDRTKLLVIAYKDDLLAPENKRNHTFYKTVKVSFVE
jgi:hypothetical protein